MVVNSPCRHCRRGGHKGSTRATGLIAPIRRTKGVKTGCFLLLYHYNDDDDDDDAATSRRRHYHHQNNCKFMLQLRLRLTLSMHATNQHHKTKTRKDTAGNLWPRNPWSCCFAFRELTQSLAGRPDGSGPAPQQLGFSDF